MKHATLVLFSILLAIRAMAQDIPETPLLELTGHTRQITDVDVSSDGSRILTAGEDKTVRLWDAQTGEQLGVYEHPEQVPTVKFSSNEQQFVSKSVIGAPVSSIKVRTWDSLSGEVLHTVTIPRNAHVLDERWTVSFEFMGAGSTPQVPQDRLYVHDNRTGEARTVNYPSEFSWSFADTVSMTDAISLRDSHLALFVYNSATYMFFPSFSNYTELWDTHEWIPLRRDSGAATSLSFSDRYYAALSISPGRDYLRYPYMRETESGRRLQGSGLSGIFPYSATASAIGPDGRVALATYSVSYGGPYLETSFCILWDTEIGAALWDTGTTKNFTDHEASTAWRSFVLIDEKVHDVSFLPDGRRFVSVGTDGIGRIWDISDLVQSDVGKEAGEY